MIDELQLTVQTSLNFAELDRALVSNGMQRISSKTQVDIFMVKKDENFDNLADFEKLSRAIIVRDVAEFKGLIYKKRDYDIFSASLKQSRTELRLVDLKEGIRFLEALGYQEYFTLNQALYEYANQVNKICVSVINDLGVFVEIRDSHMNYFNGSTKEELKRILKNYVPNIMNDNYYVNKALLMINKISR